MLLLGELLSLIKNLETTVKKTGVSSLLKCLHWKVDCKQRGHGGRRNIAHRRRGGCKAVIMRRCEGRRGRGQNKWIQWDPERIRQKRQRGDLTGRLKQAFPRQPLASLTLKSILCTEKLTFKKCVVSLPWWWRNYHKDHTAPQSEWSSCGEHCVEALAHFITFNLLRKSIYSAVLTDFLEAKSHWSVPSLQADFHDPFSKKQSREKGLLETHYSDLYNKKR